ncbi:mRNA cleavage and polyadenylation factor subunit [Serendipita sp. 405]|nr:mRNA cleavage and polyadenylation factor subunit [Serendipita sp. 405]
MASQGGAAQGLSLAQLLEPTMLGIYNEILPPSGVEFAVFLNLGDLSFSHQLSVQFKHLAVGRSNVLRIYEVRQHLADTDSEDKPEIRSPEHTGYRLHLLRQHLLHGIITGLAAVQTLASDADGRDRLLVSFEDAKLALLEWSDALYDITTVSIHTYERSVYLLNAEFASSRVQLRTDPNNRCAALIFPRDAIALLPWYQTQAEFDLQDSVQTHTRDLPYSPSFIVKYSSMDERIRNVVDVAFLPGFNTPTIAVLFQPQQTWSGRLKEFMHVHLDHEGRLVRKLTVEQQMGRCSPPSVLLVQNSVVFVGSLISRSVLLHSQTSEPDKNASLSADGYDNEIDIAWNSTKTRLTISPCDAIEDPGAFIKATFCLRPHGETSLVATSGLDTLGGFSIFNRRIPTRIKKKMPAIAGRRGIWSMRLDQDARSGHRSTASGLSSSHDDNILFSTDMNPAPGASRIASKSQARLDVNITNRLPMLTVAIAPFFSQSHLLQVTTNSLRLLTPGSYPHMKDILTQCFL